MSRGKQLYENTRNNDIAGVHTLVPLLSHHELNWANEEEETSLSHACRYAFANIAGVLIEAGADVHKAKISGSTPLHMAAASGCKRSIKRLIKRGANVNKAKNNGITPIYFAAQNGYNEAIEILLQSGADVNKAEDDGTSALYMAVQNGHNEAMEVLVKAGADVNKATDGGFTPLLVAASYRRNEAIEILVKAGADVNKARDNGVTPLYIAAQNGHNEAIEVLVKAGADVNKAEDDGTTPLYMATQNRHNEAIEVLVKAGADLNIARENRITPLRIAVQNGHLDIVKYLCEAGANRRDVITRLAAPDAEVSLPVARYLQLLPPQSLDDVFRADARQTRLKRQTEMLAKQWREENVNPGLVVASKRVYEDASFFWPTCTKQEAEKKLLGSPPGSFIARWSSEGGKIAISYVEQDRSIHHLLVSVEANGIRFDHDSNIVSTLAELAQSSPFLTIPISKQQHDSGVTNYGDVPSVPYDHNIAPFSSSDAFKSTPENILKSAYVTLTPEAERAFSNSFNSLKLESRIRAEVRLMLQSSQQNNQQAIASDSIMQSLLYEFDQLKEMSSSQFAHLQSRMDAERVHFESQIRAWTQSAVYSQQLQKLEQIARQNAGNLYGLNANVAQMQQRLQSVASSNAIVRAHLEDDIRLANAQRAILNQSQLVVAFYRGLLQLFSAKLESALILATGMVQRGKSNALDRAGKAVAFGAENVADNIDALLDVGQVAASCIPIVGNVVGLLMRKGAEKLGDARSKNKLDRVGAQAITSEDARRLASHAAVYCTNQLSAHIDANADKLDEQKSFVAGRKAADTMYGVVIDDPKRFDQLLNEVEESGSDLQRSAAALSKAVVMMAMESKGRIRRHGGIFEVPLRDVDIEAMAAAAAEKHAGKGLSSLEKEKLRQAEERERALGAQMELLLKGKAIAGANASHLSPAAESVASNVAFDCRFGACTRHEKCVEYIRPKGNAAREGGACARCGCAPLEHKEL